MSTKTEKSNTRQSQEALVERKYRPFRLSVTALRLIDLLAQKRGISRTSVLEWALRDMAEKYAVTAQ